MIQSNIHEAVRQGCNHLSHGKSMKLLLKILKRTQVQQKTNEQKKRKTDENN